VDINFSYIFLKIVLSIITIIDKIRIRNADIKALDINSSDEIPRNRIQHKKISSKRCYDVPF